MPTAVTLVTGAGNLVLDYDAQVGVNTAISPEPSTLLLGLVGGVGVVGLARRGRKVAAK